MGISAILAAALRHISWGQVADIAMQYGPDFIRKLKERLQTSPGGDGEATAELLSERIRELESALLKQEEMIERQNRNIELLEEIGRTLQARLNVCLAVSAVSALLSIILLVLFLNR